MTVRLAGIRRKTEFSPNHVVNDSLIIHRTGDALRELGADIAWYDEGTVTPEAFPEKAVFSMAQGPSGSATLAKIEDRGAMIINSPRSVMNCYRTSMVKLLPAAGVPFPKSVIVSTGDGINPRQAGFTSSKIWIKRGDVHAVHKEDVTLASTDDEELTLLREFYSRDIRQAILQEHLEGDTVKFYAVRESDLFHWYYLNGVHRTPFPAGKLREIASVAAEALGLFVYGGDAIIDRDGSISIIDINDWPSFAPVRDDASRAIAKLVYTKAQQHLSSHD
jgi:glutathione synthase/RimK-type ligase-like ATP-grasp enzyme